MPLTIKVTLKALDSRLRHTKCLLHLSNNVLLGLFDRWELGLCGTVRSHTSATSLDVVCDNEVELLDGYLKSNFAPWPVLVHVALGLAYRLTSRCRIDGGSLQVAITAQGWILRRSVLTHEHVFPDAINLLFEMSLGVAGLRLQARDGLLLCLELELKPLKFELVIALVAVSLRCSIAQILLLPLQQLIRALYCLDLSCQHRHFDLRVCELLVELLDLVRCLSLLMGDLGALSLHLGLDCFQAAELSGHVGKFLLSFAERGHTVRLAL